MSLVSPFRAGWLMVGAFALGGCADEVPRQTPDRRDPPGEPCIVTSERDGDYLLVVAFDELPEPPAPFLATIEVTGGGVSLTLVPLHAFDRELPTVDPATGTQVFGPFPIEPDGRITFELPQLFFPEATNPFHSELEIDAILLGAFCRLDAVSLCGELMGTIIQFSVEGSFTMTPIVKGQHREPPPIDCTGKLAAPL